MDVSVREELVRRLRRFLDIPESWVVIRQVIPPDFGVPEWGMPVIIESFENKVIYFDSIIILKGVGKIKIRIGAVFYLVEVHKDYMELFEATDNWLGVRRLKAFNRVITNAVELKKIIEPDWVIEIIGEGVEFVPNMIVAERRRGEYIYPGRDDHVG